MVNSPPFDFSITPLPPRQAALHNIAQEEALHIRCHTDINKPAESTQVFPRTGRNAQSDKVGGAGAMNGVDAMCLVLSLPGQVAFSVRKKPHKRSRCNAVILNVLSNH